MTKQFTEEQVERAMVAYRNAPRLRGTHMDGPMRAALEAALPDLIDVDELAKVIANENEGSECGYSHIDAKKAARAVAEYLGKVK